MKTVSAALKNYIVDAVALIVLGLVLTIWHKYTLLTVFKWLALGLLVMGAGKAVLYFLRKEKKRRLRELLMGLVQLVLAALVFFKGAALTDSFPLIVAVILACGAVVMLLRAVSLRKGVKKDFLLVLSLGIFCLVLAVVVFVHPAVLADVMLQAAGVAMIAEGVCLLVALSRKGDKTEA